MEVGFICRSPTGDAKPASIYLKDSLVIVQKSLFTKEGLDAIVRFTAAFDASGIMCIDEKIALWLNEHKATFSSSVQLWIPPSENIKAILSKKRQIDAAQEVGLDVLPTYLLDGRETGRTTIDQKDFPLCLRPSVPDKVKPAFRVHMCRSRDELGSFLGNLHFDNEPVIAQPFRNLPSLVVHGARTVSGQTIGLQGFAVDRKFEGVALTIRPTALRKDLLERCVEFTGRLGVIGNYHFDFLFDPGSETAYFLELNNRLGGTTAKVLACGYDEPYWALKAYGVDCRETRKLKNLPVSSKKVLAKYAVKAVRGELSSFDYPNETLTKRLCKTFLAFCTYRDDVLSLKDLRGSLAFHLSR
jgi:hypothetical protein